MGMMGLLSVQKIEMQGVRVLFYKSCLIYTKINIFPPATQETDSSTPSGELLQNMQLLFSKLDNDQRKQKCIAGMQEMMRAGDVPNHAPKGYTHIKDADWDHRIVVDEKIAPLIKKAFVMKAKEGKSNTEIADLLTGLGLKADRKRITEILANPFYCGVLTSSLLPGEVVQGKHPAIISEELFLKVNAITSKAKHGEREQKEYEEFPLKQFAKCDGCGAPLTAYHVKKKKATYYKCNTIGCKLNRNTKILHDKFIARLKEISTEPRAADPIEEMMNRVFSHFYQSTTANVGQLHKKLIQVEANIEKLIDKYVAEAISKEMFDKTLVRYTKRQKEIRDELPKQENRLSNLDQEIRGCLQLSKSLYETWQKAKLGRKQKVQNLIFPEGLRFNKVKNDYRTPRTHFYFATIALLSRGLAQKKGGTSNKIIEDSALVPRVGIEPTSQ